MWSQLNIHFKSSMFIKLTCSVLVRKNLFPLPPAPPLEATNIAPSSSKSQITCPSLSLTIVPISKNYYFCNNNIM